MAESLSPWLVRAIPRACASAVEAVGPASDKGGSVSLLRDAPFEKGSKVQIHHFLGFGTNHDHLNRMQDDSDEDDGQIPVQSAQSDGVLQADVGVQASALWAIVGDRSSHICVKFSKQCVQHFNRTHTRSLLSMRGSIIALRSYRLSVSSHAARLYAAESDASITGPFSNAQATSKQLLPRLCLQIESITLWGCINASKFWPTYDLETYLKSGDVKKEQTTSKELEDRRTFRKWLGPAMKEKMQRKKFSRSTSLNEPRIKAQVIETAQRVTQIQEPSKQGQDINTLGNCIADSSSRDLKPGQPLRGWGDFSLSWDDDDFGLASAAKATSRERLTLDDRIEDDFLDQGEDNDNAELDELERWRDTSIVAQPQTEQNTPTDVQAERIENNKGHKRPLDNNDDGPGTQTRVRTEGDIDSQRPHKAPREEPDDEKESPIDGEEWQDLVEFVED